MDSTVSDASHNFQVGTCLVRYGKQIQRFRIPSIPVNDEILIAERFQKDILRQFKINPETTCVLEEEQNSLNVVVSLAQPWALQSSYMYKLVLLEFEAIFCPVFSQQSGFGTRYNISKINAKSYDNKNETFLMLEVDVNWMIFHHEPPESFGLFFQMGIHVPDGFGSIMKDTFRLCDFSPSSSISLTSKEHPETDFHVLIFHRPLIRWTAPYQLIMVCY